jgi:uncharacterized protein (TIGR02996 family)
MNEEAGFLQALAENPDDKTARLIYADWLDDHGEIARAEFIRLDLSRGDIPKSVEGDIRRKAVMDRLRELRRSIDCKWAATFDEFDCLIWDSRTVRVRINTYGSAPKKYGKRAVKISAGEALFLLREGWERLGEGSNYFYFRLPEGQPTRDPIITIQVPTDAEVERLAMAWHRKGESLRTFLGPWFVTYQARGAMKVTMRTVEFTAEHWGRDLGEHSLPESPAQFDFGSSFPWSISLLWEEGNEQPPRWSRGESRVVLDQ